MNIFILSPVSNISIHLLSPDFTAAREWVAMKRVEMRASEGLELSGTGGLLWVGALLEESAFLMSLGIIETAVLEVRGIRRCARLTSGQGMSHSISTALRRTTAARRRKGSNGPTRISTATAQSSRTRGWRGCSSGRTSSSRSTPGSEDGVLWIDQAKAFSASAWIRLLGTPNLRIV